MAIYLSYSVNMIIITSVWVLIRIDVGLIPTWAIKYYYGDYLQLETVIILHIIKISLWIAKVARVSFFFFSHEPKLYRTCLFIVSMFQCCHSYKPIVKYLNFDALCLHCILICVSLFACTKCRQTPSCVFEHPYILKWNYSLL